MESNVSGIAEENNQEGFDKTNLEEITSTKGAVETILSVIDAVPGGSFQYHAILHPESVKVIDNGNYYRTDIMSPYVIVQRICGLFYLVDGLSCLARAMKDGLSEIFCQIHYDSTITVVDLPCIISAARTKTMSNFAEFGEQIWAIAPITKYVEDNMNYFRRPNDQDVEESSSEIVARFLGLKPNHVFELAWYSRYLAPSVLNVLISKKVPKSVLSLMRSELMKKIKKYEDDGLWEPEIRKLLVPYVLEEVDRYKDSKDFSKKKRLPRTT